jgi:hypothetical protein
MKASVEEGPERTCLELEETVPPLLERDLALWRVWAARWGSLGARAKCVSGPLAKGQLGFGVASFREPVSGILERLRAKGLQFLPVKRLWAGLSAIIGCSQKR